MAIFNDEELQPFLEAQDQIRKLVCLALKKENAARELQQAESHRKIKDARIALESASNEMYHAELKLGR